MNERENDERSRAELLGTITLLRSDRDLALNDNAKLRRQVAALQKLIREKLNDIEHAMNVTLALPEGDE